MNNEIMPVTCKYFRLDEFAATQHETQLAFGNFIRHMNPANEMTLFRPFRQQQLYPWIQPCVSVGENRNRKQRTPGGVCVISSKPIRSKIRPDWVLLDLTSATMSPPFSLEMR